MRTERNLERVILVLALITLLSLPFMIGAAQGMEPLPHPAQGAPPFVAGQILLRVEPWLPPAEAAWAVDAVVVRSLGDGRVQLLEIKRGSVPEAVKALRAMPGVIFAEPNWLRQLHQGPNDPGYSLKWDLNNDGSLCDGADCASEDADMDWQEAYDLESSFTGSATVAVIDTGIDLNHPDLNDKISSGYDFLDADEDPTDTYGHGTHVAGIALAETNNFEGTAGVGYSPYITVMPLRVCDEYGCPTSAIVDAIYYAAGNGANVINMSLGGPFGSSSEELAINDAWSKGLVVVASSGNDGAGRVSYPAAFANCIAVGSTNWHDQLAPYSNRGKDLDVVAPGGDMDKYHDPGGIYSTMPTYDVYLTTTYAYSKDYDQLQGTSMAAPQVSGLAALLFAMQVRDTDGDGFLNDQIRDLIEDTADDLGKPGWDRDYGWGRINVYNAVLAALGIDNPPTVTITTPNDGGTVAGTVTITADASDDYGVNQVEFFVDGSSIDKDADGSDGWSTVWDTTAYDDGSHTVSATATDTANQTSSDSISVKVDNTTSAGVTVNSITPVSMEAGTSEYVTISGSGFVSGAEVTFENGDGPAPTAADVSVSNDGTNISAYVTAKSGGPPRNRVWDVRVTNPDGSSGVLVDGFTVTP